MRGRSASREQVVEETMKPYSGPSTPGVDASTLTGKVMCGYQGWHAAEGDGWARLVSLGPGGVQARMLQDRPLARRQRTRPRRTYATAFRHADGRPAEVYSAFNRKTVLRHFQWMREYGIDGVFVQRFVGEVSNPAGLRQFNTVLGHCREGANRNGRAYAVMYDLPGCAAGRCSKRHGRLETAGGSDADHPRPGVPASPRQAGRGGLGLWLQRRPKYTLAEGMELVRFLKDDPKYGGNTVMLGVPTYWRTLDRDYGERPEDARTDPQGRHRQPLDRRPLRQRSEARNYAEKTLVGRPRLVQGARQGLSAGGLSRASVGTTCFRNPVEPDSPAGRQIPLGAVRRGEEGRAHDGLPGDVRRGGRRHGHLTNAPTTRRWASRSSSPTKGCRAITI